MAAVACKWLCSCVDDVHSKETDDTNWSSSHETSNTNWTNSQETDDTNRSSSKEGCWNCA